MAKFEFNKGIYEGEAVDEIPNGKGKLTFEGTLGYYEGDFVNGSFHGYGKFYLDGYGCFEGKWENHRFIEGKANYYFIYGGYEMDTIYEGKFEEFFLIGDGKITRANGEIYEGATLNGKPHGKGKLTLCDGTVIQGDWVDGVKKYEYTDEDYENAGGDERFVVTDAFYGSAFENTSYRHHL